MSADGIEFRVKPGSSVRGIAQSAQAAGLDVNEFALAAYARVTESAQSLRAGRYAVERGTTLAGLLSKLRAGDVIHERLTIVEGTTFRELRSQLAGMSDQRVIDLHIAVPTTVTGDMHLFAWRMLLGLEVPSACRTGADHDVWQDALHSYAFAHGTDGNWLRRKPLPRGRGNWATYIILKTTQ
jgi:hypothetical protein